MSGFRLMAKEVIQVMVASMTTLLRPATASLFARVLSLDSGFLFVGLREGATAASRRFFPGRIFFRFFRVSYSVVQREPVGVSSIVIPSAVSESRIASLAAKSFRPRAAVR